MFQVIKIKINKIFKFIFLVLVFNVFSFKYSVLYGSSLNIDTEYRLRGLNYLNTDFDTTTSEDSIAYYNQRLKLSIYGKLSAGRFGSEIEIYTGLQSLGIVGSTNTITVFSSSNTVSENNWQNEFPYPNTNFLPFISYAYMKLTNVNGLPVDLIMGRQPIEYGSGLIIGDNGMGYDSIRLIINYPRNYKTEIFTSKLKENFKNRSDKDINGVVISGPYKKTNFEFGYFDYQDYSGTIYRQGLLSQPTKSIVKQFYDFRIFKKDETKGQYGIEYAIEKGEILKSDDSKIKIDNAKAYLFSALLISQTKLGKTTVRFNVAGASGDENIQDINDDDSSFVPDLTKRFDGLDRSGYATFLNIAPYDSLLDVFQQNYSGFGTINLKVNFSPLYGWEFGIGYYYFSAAETISGNLDAPQASKPEIYYLGQKYSLGIERDISVKYVYSKYIDFSFVWAVYIPSSMIKVIKNTKPDEMYLFETNWRF